MDVWGFSKAIFKDWVSLMSGIASVLLSVIGIARKWEQIPQWAFWTAALVCFFFAAARVWTAENRKYLEEAKKNNPLLVGIFEHLLAGQSHAQSQFKTQLLVTMTVKNLGAPSVAESFTLIVEYGGKIEEFTADYIPDGTILEGPSGAFGHFKAADALYEKTVTPIERGGLRRGWLRYGLPESFFEVFMTDATKVKLSIRFIDITGKRYIAPFIPTAIGEQVRYFPGAGQPFDLSKMPPRG